jgi:hypothetical protein
VHGWGPKRKRWLKSMDGESKLNERHYQEKNDEERDRIGKDKVSPLFNERKKRRKLNMYEEIIPHPQERKSSTRNLVMSRRHGRKLTTIG